MAELRRRAIVMVWDGLRPDYISPETTPRLHDLAERGVRFSDSHAIFPTVTRCNAAAIATGALPVSHGIPGNEFVLPDGDGEVLSAANASHLERLRAWRGGRILLRPTLAEHVIAAGGDAIVVGTGSPGASLLHNPRVREVGGRIYNQALWLGDTREAMESGLGPMPDGELPNTTQNAYFTRLITDLLLPGLPDLVVYWHAEPDRTTHVHGVGHPETMRSVRDADANLGAILDAVGAIGLGPSMNVIVTSDHGFSTMGPPLDLPGALAAAGEAWSLESRDVLIAAGGIYLHDPRDREERIARVVRALQALDGMGCLFTGARGGAVAPGTLPLAAVGHGGALEPDILFSPSWSDEPNEHGFPGTRSAEWAGYAANHGALSPWEVRNTLIAAGPDFKSGLVSDVPAATTDIAPTLMHVMGLEPHASHRALPDGRVLAEALAGGPSPAEIPVERETLTAETAGYRQYVRRSRVGDALYVDEGDAERD